MGIRLLGASQLQECRLATRLLTTVKSCVEVIPPTNFGIANQHSYVKSADLLQVWQRYFCYDSRK